MDDFTRLISNLSNVDKELATIDRLRLPISQGSNGTLTAKSDTNGDGTYETTVELKDVNTSAASTSSDSGTELSKGKIPSLSTLKSGIKVKCSIQRTMRQSAGTRMTKILCRRSTRSSPLTSARNEYERDDCADELTGDLLKAELRDGSKYCSNGAAEFMEPLLIPNGPSH